MTAVFVYGTLMRGERNHALLKSAVFVSEARTEPAFELVDLGRYPAMTAPGVTAIAGELWEVDDATLAALDALEEVPTLYDRVPVSLAGGARAMTYVMPPARLAGRPRIASGSWRLRQP